MSSPAPVKVLHSICQQIWKIWKTQQWPHDWKSGFHSSSKEGNAKECSHTAQLHISHAYKLMLKIIQARLQQYVNQELSDVQLDVEKAEKPKIKLPTSVGS